MKRLISTILALTMVVSLFSNVAAVKGIAAEPPSDDLSYEAWSTWTSTKTSSAFFGEDYTQVVQENAKAYPKYQNDIDSQVKSAEFYLKQPLEYFDAMVFSPTITRAHMVFSNGWCPSCKKSVGLYDWKLNATGEPWKTRCPHCDDVFPKNDFKAFYESALDEQGYFRIENGDRSLLYNTEHPDPNDPLHMFGVDDGTGYKEGEGETWWFIGYYLIWGQWRRNIMPAVRTLSTAYSYTGNIEYARRLGILIDRLADFFPEYDFATQGILYNGDSISAGSVSYRIDNPGDCANIALAYDRVYDAIKTDTVFQEFVHQKAVERGLENEKTTFSQIAHNIEKNILRFIISDDKTIRDKIQSNYPATENCILTIMNVLDKNRYQKSIDSLLDTVLKTATAYDGTNNEKGFSNYTIMNRANFYNVLASVAAYDETFMPRVVEKYPNIIKSFEIFRDLWAFGSFYPSNGDGGNFWDRSLGYTHSKTMNGSLGTPNNATVLWELYKITKDPTIIQFFAQQRAENPETLLPIDTKNLSAIGTQMQAIIDQYGTEVDRKTGNFSQYGLSMFHQGSGATERAFWFDSDTGSPHGHYDALSYGLYGYNTNLMVDLGYPPLNYPGSWSSDECWWYKATPMHNTVSFNRDFNRFWYPGPNPFDQSTLAVNSEQTLFADGKSFKAIGADGRAVVANIGQNTRQYDRVVAMNNIDEDSFYMFDVFRVNSDLVPYCMYQTGDATLTMDNDMTPLSGKGPFHEKWMIKNVESAANVTGNATATFQFNKTHLEKTGADPNMNLFVNLTDLTSGSRNLYTMDKWFNYDLQTATAPAYLPGLAISVEKEGEFADVAFVNIVEPYDGNSKIKQINRLDITNASGETKPDCDAAVEVALNNGRTDLIISNDVLDPINKKSAEDKTVSYVTDWDVRFDGELAMISRSDNHISKIALTNAKSLSIGDYTINLVDDCDYIELEFDGDITRVVSGNINDIIVEPKPVHFKDVKNSDWYYDAVAYVNTKGLFNGVSATEFGPNLSTTRAMLATVINRMAGNLEASGNAPFADVSNSDWFAPGVAWASEAKIVNGIGNQKFAPNSFITREQLCTMLLRYAEYAEITLPETVTITFNDTHQISNYAKNAVDAMSKAGVINGKNRGNFDPKGLATRAEVATMIYRFFQITSANNAK